MTKAKTFSLDRKKWISQTSNTDSKLQWTDNKEKNETFQFELLPAEYCRVAPDHSKSKGLQGEWCDVIYNKFHSFWPTCGLTFIYNNIRKEDSRKSNSPYWVGKGRCKINDCITATFQIANKPEPNESVPVRVTIYGKCTHSNSEEQSGDPIHKETIGISTIHKRHLKGTEREIFANLINDTNTTPRKINLQKLYETDERASKAGNV